MYWTERHVFACTGNHCNQKGAAKVINRLRFELMRRKLTHTVHMNTCGTIDLCDIGPNIVVYPDNIVFSNVEENDVPDIVAFLSGGDVPERLLLNADTPVEVTRREFFAELRLDGNQASLGEVDALAEKQGLNHAWIEEQLRRGFMSKKPDEASGQDVYALTSKALYRYRLAE
jgi:(2Fe-2S) ferredoxin